MSSPLLRSLGRTVSFWSSSVSAHPCLRAFALPFLCSVCTPSWPPGLLASWPPSLLPSFPILNTGPPLKVSVPEHFPFLRGTYEEIPLCFSNLLICVKSKFMAVWFPAVSPVPGTVLNKYLLNDARKEGRKATFIWRFKCKITISPDIVL